MTWRGIEAVGTTGTDPGSPARLVVVDDDALGAGDVTIDVAWSSLNYKDALALAGRPGIVRLPRVIAGIDLVGVVAESQDPEWSPGDRVLVNGCGLGETHPGGLAERARVPGDWLIRVPDAFDLRQAAAIGTAGFTAGLAVLELERAGVTGDVLVTGASGGVGSFAVALLAAAGLGVVAATGRREHAADLRELGAATVIDRSELEAASGALQTQRWGGAVDTVGGRILANVLAQTRYGGVVASCGGVASSELPTTVMPFILRAVSLVGINSVQTPRELRRRVWSRLAADLDPDVVDRVTREVALHDAIRASAELLAGNGRGRVVVDVHGTDR
jgi:acrylyl-CoA reductase (NADPH)